MTKRKTNFSIVVLISIFTIVSIFIAYDIAHADIVVDNDTIETFQTTQNAIDRKKMLAELSDDTVLISDGPIVKAFYSDWNERINLLRIALNDKNPTVAEEAIRQIGKLRGVDFNGDLTALFDDAFKRYRGYFERIQLAIISAMGKIQTEEAIRKLSELLENDNCTNYGGPILKAIQELNDPAFIDTVVKYRDKMKEFVYRAQEKKMDPMTYSMAASYQVLADEVIASLQAGKEADNE